MVRSTTGESLARKVRILLALLGFAVALGFVSRREFKSPFFDKSKVAE